MKEMEEGLHRLHALDRRHGDFEDNAVRARAVHVEAEAPVQTVDAVASAPDPWRPFALVDEVSENSPSSEAGLRVGDEVVRSRHVTFETPNALEAFARVVKESENEELVIMVKRGETMLEVRLTPSAWQGRGLLVRIGLSEQRSPVPTLLRSFSHSLIHSSDHLHRGVTSCRTGHRIWTIIALFTSARGCNWQW